MTRKVLFVDDEPNILHGIRRTLRRNYDVETAPGPEEGLRLLDDRGPFAVVVSDYRMPVMTGVDFLAEVQRRSPDSVRMMLTGQADMSGIVGAINRSKVFRYLSKPLAPDDLVAALEDGLSQYQLVISERQLLEQTLSSSIQALIDLLGMVNPAAFSRSARIKRYVTHVAQHLGLEDCWKYEIAGTVSQVGCATIPGPTMEKILAGQEISAAEQEMFDSHPEVSYSLLKGIPRLEEVAWMVRAQRGDFGALPEGPEGDRARLGASLIRAATLLDEAICRGKSHAKAIAELRASQAGIDEEHLKILEQFHDEECQATAVRLATLADLAPGMLLDEDLKASNGVLLVSRGQEVNGALIQRLRNFAQGLGVQEPFRVRVPRSAPAEAALQEA